jgi:CDGSH-type Zn-finger protein
MTKSDQSHPNGKKQIVIQRDGPYLVQGRVPLVYKTQVVTEHGEPLTWKKDGQVEIDAEEYCLCRCGDSSHKPFCDGTHCKNGFDGSEHAQTAKAAEFQMTYRCGELVIKQDLSLCMNSGFCGLRDTNLFKMIAEADDSKTRSLAIAMVERCPSGALTYKVGDGGEDIEPDLPQQIAVTTEITASGPCRGSLWVTGSIEIVRSDGQGFIPRNRVTLCNCGRSKNKPLCDGAHRCEVTPAAEPESAAA